MNATEKPLKLPLTYYWSEHFSFWVIRDGDNHQIAQVENEAKARLIVKACNSYDKMVSLLQSIFEKGAITDEHKAAWQSIREICR